MLIKRGKSGGLLSIASFLQAETRREAGRSGLRVASSTFREAAAKEGLLSLYADPEETIKKYKDFDIARAMSERSGQQLLWVRARAIDADVVNANGDYFSRAELLAPVKVHKDGEEKSIPAYKTFEGVPMYTNHKNDDIEEAKGMVVFAEWDDTENCVYATFFIDEEAYPHIARGIRMGYMHDVSMGCQVEKGECSKCKNIAATESQYCDCLKSYKGKRHPKTGDKVFEKNSGIKFIELSVVGDGAFEACEIKEIYDTEEIIQKAVSLSRKAESLYGQILLAETMCPTNVSDRTLYEGCLRQIAENVGTVVRVAQTAGTLVGGQIMAGEGGNGNATVTNILKFLGIDSGQGLNVLDMLNLALNFMEVGVMNLFARKDNVDLAHVGKITKAMADLQATMQDMIDDGVDGGGAGGPAPINAGQLQQGQGAPAAPPAPGAGAPQDYQNAGAAGRMMGPGAAPAGGAPATQQQSMPMAMPFASPGFGPGVGGGAMPVAFASSNSTLVWKNRDGKKSREIFASSQTDSGISPADPSTRTAGRSSRTLRLGESVLALGNALGLSPIPVADSVAGVTASTPTLNPQRAAENTTPKKQAFSPVGYRSRQEAGGEDMEFLKRFTAERRASQQKTVTVDFNVDDANGNRITLSSDGSVRAFVGGQPVAWEPEISDEQLVAIDNGRAADVANDLLTRFATHVSKGNVRTSDWHPFTGQDVKERELEKLRKGTFDKVQEQLLQGEEAGKYGRRGIDKDVREHIIDPLRTGTDDDVKEHLLEDEAGLYARQFSDDDVREHLLEDARQGTPDDVIEHQLADVRKEYGPGAPNLVAAAVTDALARAVVASLSTPDEAAEAARILSARADVVELIKLASLGTAHRVKVAARRQFHRSASAFVPNVFAAVLHELGSKVSSQIFASDLAMATRVASTEMGLTVKSITRVARSLMGDAQGFEVAAQSAGRKTISRADLLKAAFATQAEASEENVLAKDHLRAAVLAMTFATQHTGAHPREIIATIASEDKSELANAVELSRTASATEQRLVQRARSDFWGRSASTQADDILGVTVGFLADHAQEFGMSTAAMVEAVKRLASVPRVTEPLIAKAIEVTNRTAAIQLTDDKTTTKRIVCRTEDLGGLDPKDQGFEDAFRQKAIEVLASSGYQVDPNTFAFTNLSVSDTGDISAEVSTRVSKTFSVDGLQSGSSASGNGGLDASSFQMNPASGVTTVEQGTAPDPSSATPESPDTLMSTAAKAAANARIARRNGILGRYAQMAGMGGGAGGGMGAMPMGDPAGGAPGAMGADQPPVAGFTGADTGSAGPPTGEPSDTDAMSEPGEKKPWGTVCPACGSSDTEVTSGQGHCNSCQTDYDIEILLHIKPQGKDDDNADAGSSDSDADASQGLGAATAPAPDASGAAAGGAPAAGAAPGGAPAAGGGMQVAFLTDSDVFVRTASGDPDPFGRLPVGMVCPNCGNKEVGKFAAAKKGEWDTTICRSCGTIAKSKISPSRIPSKLACAIRFLFHQASK